MKLKLKSTPIALAGHLQIVRRDANTQGILDVWEKKNVITYGAVESVVKLLAPNLLFGATVQQENAIKSMRFGVSNIAPQRTDTSLSSEAIVSGNPVRIELADANRNIGASGTVLFVATLDTGTGNGVTYREAGLYTRGLADDPLVTTGAILFAHQVFPDQIKTAAVELEFRWRITFTV